MSQSGQEGGQGTGTDGAQDGQQGNGTGTDSGQGTGNGGNGNGADSGQRDSGQDTGNTNTVSQEQFEKLKNQLSAADKAREEAQKALKTLQDKDLSELEKAKGDLQTTVEERDKLSTEVTKLRLANAFLSANTITWQNADVALGIAQTQGFLEGVQNDKGEVDTKAMAAALKKLSEEHKYLVKAGDDDSGDGDDGKPGSSGAPASRAGKGNANDDKARRDRLKQTLPALGRR